MKVTPPSADGTPDRVDSMTRTPVLSGLLSLVLAVPLDAQRTTQALEAWEPSLPTSQVSHTDQRDSVPVPRGDYRYEGLAFGGLVFGALGAWLGSREFASCALAAGGGCYGNGDRLGNGIAAGLLGAAVGGGLGYLVGRFSPKKPRPDSILMVSAPQPTSVPDSVRHKVGYQHWRGAGIGAAIGGAVGALTGAVLAEITQCSDCEPWSAGHGALVVGLLGVGTGGVVGFLAGLSSPKYEW